jgi:amphi-Trp domain-containing protein
MLRMEIFEDSRTASRADLAAWLRQLAGQLESDGKVLFGAAGSVTVGENVHCELEIDSSDTEGSIEIEFSWTVAAAAEDEPEEEDTPAEVAPAEVAPADEIPAVSLPN